ncbi:MAG: hypothetical protein AAF718_02105 [Pseudomonadota bacterium]
MLRLFTFLPPIGSYILAIGIFAGTFYLQQAMLATDPGADVNRVWLVGGLIAFLFAFGGFQRGMEIRGEKMKPRVSSADVMQKLAPAETGTVDLGLDVPPVISHGPDADSPLGRVRARSNPLETL